MEALALPDMLPTAVPAFAFGRRMAKSQRIALSVLIDASIVVPVIGARRVTKRAA